MPLVAWLLLAFAMALAGTWLARAYAVRHALLDLPDAAGEGAPRRSHALPTPRGGGIAIVLALLPVLASLAVRGPGPAAAWLAIALGLLLVAGIGWIDDHRPLGAWPRLGVHLLAAALLAHAMHRLGGSPLQLAAGFVLAVGLVNAWNFMDGIDSLAASQALLAAVAFALFAGTGPLVLLGGTLAAACAGFLPFNLPRARIFLGDVGSGALGYLLASLASLLLLQVPWRAAPLLLLPLLVFLVDATLTLGRRIVHGERWWQPHAQHAYQHWARRCGSHGRVVLAYLAASGLAIALMFAANAHSFAVIMGAVGLAGGLGCLAWQRLQQGPGPTAGEGG